MGKRIQKQLEELVDDESEPKLVRRRALEASIRFQRGWHADAIRFAWQSEDADWRLTAVFCMGYLRGFQKQIIEALKDPAPQVVAEAIRAAGNWELQEGRALVKSVLTAASPPREQLFAALQAAAWVIPADDARAFLKRFKRHADQEVREIAIEALEELELLDFDEDDELW